MPNVNIKQNNAVFGWFFKPRTSKGISKSEDSVAVDKTVVSVALEMAMVIFAKLDSTVLYVIKDSIDDSVEVTFSLIVVTNSVTGLGMSLYAYDSRSGCRWKTLIDFIQVSTM